MKAIPKTNPDLKTSQGMEVFLQPPKKEEIKVNASNPNKTNLQVENPPKEIKNETQKEQERISKEKEIEQIVEQLEQKLSNNIKVLDLTTFGELMFRKQLQFKLMFVRTKIYVLVKDPNSGKTAMASIKPPRWGGSSLRYLISECVSNWCMCVEKATSKGKILTYKSSTTEDNTDDIDIDDIFE